MGDNEKTYSRLARSFLPSTGVLEMTYRCNHRCLFCSCPWQAENNGFRRHTELTTQEWKDCIAKLCTMGVSSFAFTGGEPLMKEGILQLIEFAASCTTEHFETKDGSLVSWEAPPNLYLLSNGRAMSDEVLELCRRFRVNVSMSLPGLETFGYHTQGGDPGRVLEWFRRAHEMGVTTTVNITVTKKNIHELFETIGEGFLAGADTLLMNRFLPGGRGITYAEELCLSIEEIVLMLDTAEEVLRTANRYGSVGTELPKCILDPTKYERLSVGTRCSAALDFFVIGPSGYVRACNHSPVRMEHMSEIEKVKDNPYWKKFVFKDYLPKECSGCGDMLSCDGGCREAANIVGGRVDAIDPALYGIELPYRPART
jgi:radical SAM protein with 4Fe4S-binding SPASM domain